jgi:glycosyltransferase involved in cell wall biosynthesis
MSLPPLSVVIPTLGHRHLVDTVALLNSGSIKPNEILICIPRSQLPHLLDFDSDNIKLVVTKKTGQVAQRLDGFKLASNQIVLQMDDDIYVKQNTLEILLKHLLTIGKGSIVGPIFYNVINGRPLTCYSKGVLGLMDNLYAWFVWGLPWGHRRAGALSNFGCAGGVDPRYHSQALLRTSWLPGGCSMTFKENLILSDFFSFSGKAYSEDLIHSKLRADSAVSHYVAMDAAVSTKAALRTLCIADLKAELRARIHVARVLGGSPTRAFIAVVMDVSRRFLITLSTKVRYKSKNEKEFH